MTTKDFKKKHVKDIKIFLKKKKTKGKKKACEIYQQFFEGEKEKAINTIVNIIKIFVMNKNKSYLSIEWIIL